MPDDTAHPAPRPAEGLIIIAILLVGVLGPKLLFFLPSYVEMMRGLPIDLRYLVHPAMRMLLVAVGWMLLVSLQDRDRHATLGLRVGWAAGLKGAAVGLLGGVPMLLFGLWGGWRSFDRIDVIHRSLMPGITEEIFYRAFAFGLLVQLARWRLWPAAVFTGVVFGLAHVDITPGPDETILGQLNLWIAMIALGGVLYAWIFRHANWNLWVVIALHFTMNLWWQLLDLTATPLGALGSTLARVLSVGLVIWLVIFVRVLDPCPGGLPSADGHQ